ncbi:MAG: hypothetical protein IJU40_04985 [Desulfovibrionaceae bacterium]|nr:hypothetical protein [Desulfovibrionaceae bacterium]
MDNFTCPKCSNELIRCQRKDKPTEFFWACSQNNQGCNFLCDDLEGHPFLNLCPECHEVMRYKISPKTQKPYIACFNKENHASKEVLFFSPDGTLSTYQKPKGTFYCPECQGELLYRRVTKGHSAGHMIFICPEAEKHRQKKALFFGDDGGKPAFKTA